MGLKHPGMLLVLAGFMVAGGLVFRPDRLDPVASVLFSLTIVVCMVPALSLRAPGRPRPLPILPAIALFHLVMSGLSAFLIVKPAGVDDLLVRQARLGVEPAALIFIGVTLLLCTAWFARERLFGRVPSLLGNICADERVARVLLWGLLAYHLAFYAYPPLLGVPSLGHFAKSAGYVAFGGLVLMGMAGYLGRLEFAVVVFAMLPFRLALGFLNGALGEAIYLMGFLLLLIFHRKPRLTVAVFAAVAILAVVSYKPVHMYRAAFASPGFKAETWQEKAQAFWNTLRDGGYYGLTEDKSDWDFSRRLAHPETLNTVMAETPANIPYWRGETYTQLLTNLVPRALWPDKPQERRGNEFARRYGFVAPHNFDTSMNLPWLVEAFVNFGWLGVMLVMPMIGLTIGFAEAGLNRPGLSSWQLAVAGTILASFINQDSNLSLSIGAVLQTAIALAAYFAVGAWVLARVPRSQRPAA